MLNFSFSTTSSLIVGAHSIKTLAANCSQFGMSKVLIVTDKGIVSLGLHTAALDSLEKAGIGYCLFSSVSADPTDAIVEDCLSFARAQKVDGIVGLGGGSSMDVAKLIAALAYSHQSLIDAYGTDNIASKRLPLIQIPTTAGTGSEVTPISIITTGETTKMGIVSSCLLPDLALLDPALTTGLPPAVTAATGIDAMVHAIEAYTSKHKKNLYSDMLARQALTLLSANIETAVKNGDDMNAREAMMLGATLAGQAFANAPVAAVHALAYPLGGHFHIPHGLSNSLVLPHVMRFNAPECAGLYAELAPCIDPNFNGSTHSDKAASHHIINHLQRLIQTLALPTTLKDMSVKKEQLAFLAHEAVQQQRLLVNNPRVVTEQDALDIYEAAYA